MSYLDRPVPPKGPPWAHNSLGATIHNALAGWWRLPLARRTVAAEGPVPHDGEFPDFTSQLTAIGEHLLTLPADTRVLPGHGQETTIALAEKKFDSWVSAGPVVTSPSGLGD